MSTPPPVAAAGRGRGVPIVWPFGQSSESVVSQEAYNQLVARVAALEARVAQLERPEVPTNAFGKKKWEKYIGEVGEEPPLPANIAALLNGPCPIFPNKIMSETHLLTLIPATINGEKWTIETLGKLVSSPKKGIAIGYIPDDPSKKAAGPAKSYWVLMVRAGLPGAEDKHYGEQLKLLRECREKAKQPYDISLIIEAVVSISMAHFGSGDRLFAGARIRCQESNIFDSEAIVGGLESMYNSHTIRISFDHHGHSLVAPLIRLPRGDEPTLPAIAFGKEKWLKYLGDVGEEPPLPQNIEAILNGPCPIWQGKKVGETHLLTLVPATVNGQELTLQSLEKLVKTPKEGPAAAFLSYPFGNHVGVYGKKETSHWVLISREMLPGTFGKSEDEQIKVLESYRKQSGFAYEVPKVLDVSVSLVMEFFVSGGMWLLGPKLQLLNSLILEDDDYNPKNGVFTWCQERGSDSSDEDSRPSRLTVRHFRTEGLSVGTWGYGESGLGASWTLP